jgi:nucleoside phosphorylase
MASVTAENSRTHNAYTVGWVCALTKERSAAVAMLDEIHPKLPKPRDDFNTYSLGSISGHNVVICCLPKGKYGEVSAATHVTQMIRTFPSIKIGFMVGIGAGIPPKVKLGDVVVSVPVDQYPGVVKGDFGKMEEGKKFRRTGSLNNPPNVLLTAVTDMETTSNMKGSKIPQYLKHLEEKWPTMVLWYNRPPPLKDPPTIPGESSEPSAKRVKYSNSINTEVAQGKSEDIKVHYGLIASGSKVIKDAVSRDELNASLGGHVLCIEMEAAGLMDNFPCIVIRGICDYADSQKNDDWQEYAAAVAAACAKELLEYVQPNDVEQERPVKDLLTDG